MWYSGMRVSEVADVKAQDFDWDKGIVVVLGKGNKYRKALSGNGEVRQWFSEHDSFEISIHQVKSGLSTRVVQALGGWEQLTMVEHYSKSLTFDDALSIYHKVNGG